MPSKLFFLGMLVYVNYQFQDCKTERVSYIDTERPVVSWFNKKYLKNITLISRRLSRQDPRHYAELYLYTLFTITNDLKVDFYFYQFLTNRYKPSFVEMHFSACDLVQFDRFFGVALKKAFGNKLCPYPPGEYDLQNLTISYVPNGFPFSKGRIYSNFTLHEDGKVVDIASGSIDMEVKVAIIKNKKNN